MSEEREFERKMKRLEEIASLLDSGDLPLEDSLKLYKEGVQCSRFCREELEKAKHEVEIWNMEEAEQKESEEELRDVPF